MSNKLLIPCPHCGGCIDLELAFQDLDGRRFVELLMQLPPNVMRPLYNYLKLFKPPRQALRWSRILSITEEVFPLIKSAQLKRRGITYSVPSSEWVAVLTYLVETPPSTLSLPLKTNGYLLSILADRAEKQLVTAEAKQEQVKQSRARDSPPCTAVLEAQRQQPPAHEQAKRTKAASPVAVNQHLANMKAALGMGVVRPQPEISNQELIALAEQKEQERINQSKETPTETG